MFGPKYIANNATNTVEMNNENNGFPQIKLQITKNKIHKHINLPIVGIGTNNNITIINAIITPCKEVFVLFIYYILEKKCRN